ncbi:MAG: DUF4367 domain-containing protein [Christensenellaceae bacterium]|nr:DUF4367 domain-containing protein [Christensenellaceae bacterium]
MKDDLRKYQREEILADIEADRLRLLFYDMQVEEADAVEAKSREHELEQDSEQIEPAVIELIDKGLRRRNRRRLVREMVPPLSRAVTVAAGLLLVLFIGFSTAMAVSPSIRYHMMGLLIQPTDEYTTFGLGETASIEIPSEWYGRYYPTYIPENYELSEFYGNKAAPSVIFADPDDNVVDFSELDEMSTLVIDTENAAVTYTTVHDLQAMVVEKGRWVAVIWAENDRYFCIMANTDADTALQIARSVIKIR